jgi:hypothetical protein
MTTLTSTEVLFKFGLILFAVSAGIVLFNHIALISCMVGAMIVLTIVIRQAGIR